MNSGMMKLDLNDLFRGLITAVFTGVIVALASIVQDPSFDLFSADWKHITNVTVNAAVVTFIGYLSKNALSDKDGKFLGKV